MPVLVADTTVVSAVLSALALAAPGAPPPPPGPTAVPAPAPVRHVSVVSEDPVDYTPHVLDGIVNAIAIVGRTVVVGGEFSAVKEARPQDAPALERANLFAFDLYTGKILPSFAPEVRGVVYALAAGADGTVYVGGDFATIGRAPARGLARLRVADGAPVPGFEPRIAGGGVQTLAVQGGKVYAGGDFRRVGNAWRTGLARLDAATGAVDPSFAIEVAGPRPGAGLKVYSLAVTPTRLAVDGNFTTLDGQSRPQLGLIDIGGAKARVLPWRTEAYAPACAKSFPAYVRGLAFSPAGDYFVVVTTGGNGGAAKLCDSAARFETGAKGERIKPTWVNHTGGDSLYSVAVTGAAVYVGGHQRWLDNPRGHDSAGPGAVKRTGIGAIDPRTGKALPWNPTRTRGIGVKAFLAHPGGLLVGSDTTRLGREYHARVGMFPLG